MLCAIPEAETDEQGTQQPPPLSPLEDDGLSPVSPSSSPSALSAPRPSQLPELNEIDQVRCLSQRARASETAARGSAALAPLDTFERLTSFIPISTISNFSTVGSKLPAPKLFPHPPADSVQQFQLHWGTRD